MHPISEEMKARFRLLLRAAEQGRPLVATRPVLGIARVAHVACEAHPRGAEALRLPSSGDEGGWPGRGRVAQRGGVTSEATPRMGLRARPGSALTGASGVRFRLPALRFAAAHGPGQRLPIRTGVCVEPDFPAVEVNFRPAQSTPARRPSRLVSGGFCVGFPCYEKGPFFSSLIVDYPCSSSPPPQRAPIDPSGPPSFSRAGRSANSASRASTVGSVF